MRVEPAGIGQQPHRRAFNLLALQPQHGFGALEPCAVRAQPQKANEARAVGAHGFLKAARAGTVFFGGQLLRRGCGAPHHAGNAITKARQLGLLSRIKAARRNARKLQRRPETIARVGEVVAGRTRIEARIDADEKHLEPVLYQIGNGAPSRGLQFVGRGARSRYLCHCVLGG